MSKSIADLKHGYLSDFLGVTKGKSITDLEKQYFEDYASDYAVVGEEDYGHLSGRYGSVADERFNFWRMKNALADVNRVEHPEYDYSWGSGGGKGNSKGLVLPGAVEADASTSDHADLNITGDIDLIVKTAPLDAAANQVFIAKCGSTASPGGTLAYIFGYNANNTLRLALSPDGTGVNSAGVDSSVVLSSGSNVTVWVRATWRQSDGRTQFFTSSDGVTWTQLGTDVTLSVAGIASTSAPLEIGGRNLGTLELLNGIVHRAIVKNGINGTVVFDADFTKQTAGATSFTETTGKTVTINGTAKIGRKIDATAPFLIDLDHYGVGQALWLPGASGNYASIPDTNLLDANTAHIEQSIGKWYAFYNCSIARSTEQAEYGAASLKITATALDNVASRTSATERFPVTAGATYAASARFRPGSTVRNAKVHILYFDNVGTYIGQNTGADTPETLGGWTTAVVTGAAPTGAVTAVVDVTVLSCAAGEVHYVDKICFRTGSSTTFVPSHRITGDLDVRARIAPKAWNPASAQPAVERFIDAAGGGFLFGPNAGGFLRYAWSDGATSQGVNSAVLNVTDREPLHIRAVHLGTAKIIRFYTSSDGVAWTQLGTDISVTPGATVNTGSKTLTAGYGHAGWASFTGAHFGFEVRDGIDGPVVAAADFSNPAEATGDAFATPEGHTCTINRSGDATAEIIKENGWFNDGATILEFPSRTVFNLSDFTIAFAVRTRNGVGGMRFISKGNLATATSERALDVYVASGKMENLIGDGTNGSASRTTTAIIDGTRKNLAFQRSAGRHKAFVGGTQEADVVDSTVGVLESTNSLVVFARADTRTSAAKGFIPWFAVIPTALSTAEHTELGAWDGTIANEPVWLRDAATLYVNAEDQNLRKYYRENNLVLNLAKL